MNKYHDSGSDSDSDVDEDDDSAAFIPQNSCSDDDSDIGEDQGVTGSDGGHESGESDYESAVEDSAHAPWAEPEHELGDVPDETDSDSESGESEYESAAEDPVPSPQAERMHDDSGDLEKHSHQRITEETRSFVYWLLSQVKVLGATEFLRYRTLLKKLLSTTIHRNPNHQSRNHGKYTPKPSSCPRPTGRPDQHQGAHRYKPH